MLVDQNRDAAEDTLGMIKGEGGEGAAFTADVTRAEDCRGMVDEAVRALGRLDILDNNVGIEGRGTLLEADETQWEQVMRVNVKA